MFFINFSELNFFAHSIIAIQCFLARSVFCAHLYVRTSIECSATVAFKDKQKRFYDSVRFIKKQSRIEKTTWNESYFSIIIYTSDLILIQQYVIIIIIIIITAKAEIKVAVLSVNLFQFWRRR